MSRLFNSSHGCGWNNPRPATCEARRRHIHGPILPMLEPKGSLFSAAVAFLKRMLAR